VLPDVRGIDRIQYESYNRVKGELSNLMRDQFGAPEQEQGQEAGTVTAQLDALRESIPALLKDAPGQTMGGIASSLGCRSRSHNRW
jgi:hypothetical protein